MEISSQIIVELKIEWAYSREHGRENRKYFHYI